MYLHEAFNLFWLFLKLSLTNTSALVISVIQELETENAKLSAQLSCCVCQKVAE